MLRCIAPRRLLGPAPLGRAAAVVGDGGDVANVGDAEARRGQRAERGLASGARALHQHAQLAHAVFHGLLRAVLHADLGRERGRLPRTLVAHLSRRRRRDRVARHVGDRDEGVVEGGVNMRHTRLDVLLDSLLRALCLRHASSTSSPGSSSFRRWAGSFPCACARSCACAGREPGVPGDGAGRGSSQCPSEPSRSGSTRAASRLRPSPSVRSLRAAAPGGARNWALRCRPCSCPEWGPQSARWARARRWPDRRPGR